MKVMEPAASLDRRIQLARKWFVLSKVTPAILIAGVLTGLALFAIEAHSSQRTIAFWIGPLISVIALVAFVSLSMLMMRYCSQIVKLVLEEVQPPL
jgi:uncharacterized membrane protein YjfL (UPF0719 family)